MISLHNSVTFSACLYRRRTIQNAFDHIQNGILGYVKSTHEEVGKNELGLKDSENAG